MEILPPSKTFWRQEYFILVKFTLVYPILIGASSKIILFKHHLLSNASSYKQYLMLWSLLRDLIIKPPRFYHGFSWGSFNLDFKYLPPIIWRETLCNPSQSIHITCGGPPLSSQILSLKIQWDPRPGNSGGSLVTYKVCSRLHTFYQQLFLSKITLLWLNTCSIVGKFPYNCGSLIAINLFSLFLVTYIVRLLYLRDSFTKYLKTAYRVTQFTQLSFFHRGPNFGLYLTLFGHFLSLI